MITKGRVVEFLVLFLIVSLFVCWGNMMRSDGKEGPVASSIRKTLKEMPDSLERYGIKRFDM